MQPANSSQASMHSLGVPAAWAFVTASSSVEEMMLLQ